MLTLLAPSLSWQVSTLRNPQYLAFLGIHDLSNLLLLSGSGTPDWMRQRPGLGYAV